jgi:hypothetical protein
MKKSGGEVSAGFLYCGKRGKEVDWPRIGANQPNFIKIDNYTHHDIIEREVKWSIRNESEADRRFCRIGTG